MDEYPPKDGLGMDAAIRVDGLGIDDDAAQDDLRMDEYPPRDGFEMDDDIRVDEFADGIYADEFDDGIQGTQAFFDQLLDDDEEDEENPMSQYLGTAVEGEDFDLAIARKVQAELDEEILREERDREASDMEFARRLQENPIRRADSKESDSLRLALELSGAVSAKDLPLDDAALAARLAQQWEDEEKAQEIQDAEFAQKLMDEEEKAVAESERKKLKVSTGEVNSVEDVIEQHLEFLADSDLGSLRAYCSSGAAKKIRPILRPDLETKFRAKARELADRYGGLEFATPVVAFHGTQARHVDGIEKSGFIVPGQKGVAVAHGSRFGMGIYTSPDPGYAARYTQDGKLLCVAVLMGRASHVGNEACGVSSPLNGGDSHIAAEGKEFVVFDSSCVLPLFLVSNAQASTHFVGRAPRAPRAPRRRASRKKR